MRNRKSLKYLLAPALCAALVTAGTGMAALAQSPDSVEGPEIVTEDQIEDAAPEDGFELSGEVVDEDQNEDQKGLPSEEAESEEEASGEAEPSDGDGTGSEAAAGEAALSDQVSEDQDPDFLSVIGKGKPYLLRLCNRGNREEVSTCRGKGADDAHRLLLACNFSAENNCVCGILAHTG